MITTKLNHISKIINGSTPSSENPSYWDGDIKWITPVDLSHINGGRYIENSIRTITMEGYLSCGTTLVPKGSIILSTRAPIGLIAIAGDQLCTNQGCKSIVVDQNKVHPEFLYYFLLVKRNELQILGSGSTFLELSTDSLKSILIDLPEMVHQEKIVQFLNYKVAKIDEAIAKKKHLLALLEEKRISIIDEHMIVHQANLVPFSRLIDSIKDGTHGTHERVNEGIPLLSAKNVFNDRLIINDDESLVSKEEAVIITASGYPKKGDLLLTCVGTIGRSYVWDRENPLPFQRSVSFIRLKKKNNPYFYKYYCETRFFQDQLLLLAKTSAQSGVYMGDIKRIPAPVVPLPSQETAITKIEESTSQIRKSQNKIRTSIDLLEEYKASLISNAVMGKVKI